MNHNGDRSPSMDFDELRRKHEEYKRRQSRNQPPVQKPPVARPVAEPKPAAPEEEPRVTAASAPEDATASQSSVPESAPAVDIEPAVEEHPSQAESEYRAHVVSSPELEDDDLENDAPDEDDEESYGYLYGDHARDKDAIITAALVCFMAQADKAHGRTLIDRLNALYEKVGAWSDRLINLVFDPIPGQTAISDRVMAALRAEPPSDIAGIAVIKKIDYITGIDTLPKENVLQYILADGSVVCLRPSGTEPKMKCYISACGDTMATADALSEKLEQAFHSFVAQLKEDASS